jgi:hypothetical protein
MATDHRTDATAPPFLAFGTSDVERAHREYGFSCGPASLCACLGMTPDQIRPHLGWFERKRFMNPTMMIAAIEATGHRIASRPPHWPDHGIVRVQWEGPWNDPGVPAGAAYRHTHWCASNRVGRTNWVYDINSGWERLEEWAAPLELGGTAERIMASIRGCRRTWKLTHAWEIRKRK